MNIPVVSTITPCFRMKRYLQRFLDELPRQSFFDRLEVVLDHNEPDSEEVGWVEAFQRKYPGRIKHIVIDKVDPIGVSMNRCIRESAADFLAIWNVDDLRSPHSIEAQADILLKNTDTGIVYGDYSVVGAFGETAGEVVLHEGIPETEFTRSMIFGPFFMFRKSLCAKSGYFDEQLRSGADFDFSVRLALHAKAEMTESILGYYLNEGLGASTRPGSLQPVERTVIELRYGIYDKIDYEYVTDAAQYNVPHLKQGSEWQHLSLYVPDYGSYLDARKSQWQVLGLKRYCQNICNTRPGLKAFARRIIGV